MSAAGDFKPSSLKKIDQNFSESHADCARVDTKRRENCAHLDVSQRQ